MKTLKGIVTKSTGSWYRVLAETGESYECRIKGKFRLENSKATNPITIGDKITFHFDPVLNNAVIDSIEERKNCFVRKSSNLSKQYHIIAANLDLAVVIATLKEPRITYGFIDRFLTICEAYQITPLIVFNKVDLLDEAETNELNLIAGSFEKIGYNCIKTSAKTNQGIPELFEILEGKTTIFSGQSGVGKSSLLNCFIPGIKLKIRSLSNYSGKGQHTTTFYEMFNVSGKSFVIDSPGIKELGLYDIDPSEVSTYFPEMRKIAHLCKFGSCLHVNEPGCAVHAAVENGSVDLRRYESYLQILSDYSS